VAEVACSVSGFFPDLVFRTIPGAMPIPSAGMARGVPAREMEGGRVLRWHQFVDHPWLLTARALWIVVPMAALAVVAVWLVGRTQHARPVKEAQREGDFSRCGRHRFSG
jgi:hypothetical protein